MQIAVGTQLRGRAAAGTERKQMMKKLTPEYWKDFEYLQDGAAKKDGDKFEQLAADMLTILYQNKGITFQRTQTTHDGSKDFVGKQDGREIIWAECKNYKNSISLTQVSPTLVMAEVCQIDEIIFFSYSEITSGTRKKLCSYAQLRGKKLRLYDGEALESLIFTLGDQVLSKFFPQYTEKVDCSEIIKPYIFCVLEKDPQFYPLGQDERESDLDFQPNELGFISIGEIFSADIFFTNRDAANPLILEISLLPHNESPDDFFCFTVLDERIRTAEGKNTLTYEVQPSTVCTERIFIRYSKFKQTVYPPIIRVSYSEPGAQSWSHQEFKYPRIDTNWTRKAIFSGSGYEAIKKAFQENCLNVQKFSGALLYGNSGTGKTRLLEECTGVLLSKRYHVLNFSGWDKYPAVQIIKELIYMLYGLTDELVLESISDNAVQSVAGAKRPDFQRALDLLRQLCGASCPKETIEKHYELIFEKLMQSGYTLVIDNLQYFDVELLSFFRALIQYGLNRRRPTRTMILCSITLDQAYDDRYREFITQFHEWAHAAHSRLYCEQVSGFQDEKQALSFLASILRIQPDRLDSQQTREALANCSLRPKYIEELATYLVQEKQVILGQEGGTIPSPVLLLETIKGLPSDYGALFKERYRRLVKSCGLCGKSLTRLLSLIHLFKPLDRTTLARLGGFNEELGVLLKGGILKQERVHGRIVYTFEHDLIEQYFMSTSPDFLTSAVDHFNQSGTRPQLRQRFPVQYCLCCFRSGSADQEMVKDVRRILQDVVVPSGLERQFYNDLADWLVEIKRDGYLTDGDFLQLATDCCVHIRDFIGEDAAVPAFAACYEQIKGMDIIGAQELRQHFAFLIHYCENRNHLEQTVCFQENIKIYERYLGFLTRKKDEFPELKRELDYAYAYTQNRLFICGKHLGSHKQYVQGIQESTKCGRVYGFQDILFSNCFDASTAFLYEDTPAALQYMKTGLDTYERHRFPQYELNYYKKKIQYAILTHQTDQLDETFDEAFGCLKSSTVIKYHTYFRNGLLRLKATYLLMGDHSPALVKQALDELSMSQLLLNKKNDYIILFLLAKYLLQIDCPEDAVAHYCSALSKCIKKAADGGAARDKHNRAVIEEELVWAAHRLDEKGLNLQRDDLRGELSSENWRALSMNKRDYKKYRKNFHSCALAVSTDGQGGFVL